MIGLSYPRVCEDTDTGFTNRPRLLKFHVGRTLVLFGSKKPTSHDRFKNLPSQKMRLRKLFVPFWSIASAQDFFLKK